MGGGRVCSSARVQSRLKGLKSFPSSFVLSLPFTFLRTCTELIELNLTHPQQTREGIRNGLWGSSLLSFNHIPLGRATSCLLHLAHRSTTQPSTLLHTRCSLLSSNSSLLLSSRQSRRTRSVVSCDCLFFPSSRAVAYLGVFFCSPSPSLKK